MCNKHADNNIMSGDLNGLTFFMSRFVLLSLKVIEVHLQLSPYNVLY